MEISPGIVNLLVVKHDKSCMSAGSANAKACSGYSKFIYIVKEPDTSKCSPLIMPSLIKYFKRWNKDLPCPVAAALVLILWGMTLEPEQAPPITWF